MVHPQSLVSLRCTESTIPRPMNILNSPLHSAGLFLVFFPFLGTVSTISSPRMERTIFSIHRLSIVLNESSIPSPKIVLNVQFLFFHKSFEFAASTILSSRIVLNVSTIPSPCLLQEMRVWKSSYTQTSTPVTSFFSKKVFSSAGFGCFGCLWLLLVD